MSGQTHCSWATALKTTSMPCASCMSTFSTRRCCTHTIRSATQQQTHTVSYTDEATFPRVPPFARRFVCWLSATSSAAFKNKRTIRPTMQGLQWISCSSSSSTALRMESAPLGVRETSCSMCCPKVPGVPVFFSRCHSYGRTRTTTVTVCTGAVWWSIGAPTCHGL